MRSGATRFRSGSGGPDNPIGRYEMALGIPGGSYLIHGTNRPAGIGMQVTHGCMRLYPEDIERMFQQVPVGTQVRIINQAVKTGWHRGTLYLEVHPDLGESKSPQNVKKALEKIANAAREREGYDVDWAWAESLVAEHRGMPLPLHQQGQRGQTQNVLNPGG